MVEYLTEYQGKLYSKDAISKWDLPEKIKIQLGYEDYDYFFLTSSIEEKHGMRHVHFSVYPSKYNNVYLLDIQLKEINPAVIQDIIKLIKEKKYDVITSTGFCIHAHLCHFGVFFSFNEEIDETHLINSAHAINWVEEAVIFKYTCESCSR
jgi:hypothetical protein